MEKNNSNLLLALVLSFAIIFGWQHFYEKPRLEKAVKEHKAVKNIIEKTYEKVTDALPADKLDQEEVGRVRISSNRLEGSINLKGARFDDLILRDYKQSLDEDAKPINIFNNKDIKNIYFAQLGWFGEDKIDLPNSETIWQADKEVLNVGDVVDLTWVSPAGIKFTIKISLDEDYMFNFVQKIENLSNKEIAFKPYGLINRNYILGAANSVIHEGPLATIDGTLNEITYEKLKDKNIQESINTNLDWTGITDKYWLVALIPDKKYKYASRFSYVNFEGIDKFQVDFTGTETRLKPGEQNTISNLMFAGAKEAKKLDFYSEKYQIKLFDRAIDFGWFYVLTKPMLKALSFFYKLVNNFGVSILIVTILVKLAMLSLANKSFRSMKKMRSLQPEIEKLKKLYEKDQAKLNTEIMSLYKKEKVNPLSGCLPLIIQIPVFFSLYKVLYVSLEMRQAPFFGWIKDLSEPDPTSLFNLFGLLPFAVPEYLNIGAWPCMMCITMYLQQKLSPAPTDPVQEQVMKIMPFVFLFMFSKFPAGLVIYWTWSNVLSILQQFYIMKRS